MKDSPTHARIHPTALAGSRLATTMPTTANTDVTEVRVSAANTSAWWLRSDSTTSAACSTTSSTPSITVVAGAASQEPERRPPENCLVCAFAFTAPCNASPTCVPGTLRRRSWVTVAAPFPHRGSSARGRPRDREAPMCAFLEQPGLGDGPADPGRRRDREARVDHGPAQALLRRGAPQVGPD